MILSDLFSIKTTINFEILEQITKALIVTTSYDEGQPGPNYEKAMKVLEQLYNHPDAQPFMYKGVMYRALITMGKKGKTIEEIRSYNKYKLFSFAKTKEGVDAWIDLSGEPYAVETITTLSQTGKGYDLQKIWQYLSTISKKDIVDDATRKSFMKMWKDISFYIKRAGSDNVKEVLAPHAPNLKVISTKTHYMYNNEAYWANVPDDWSEEDWIWALDNENWDDDEYDLQGHGKER